MSVFIIAAKLCRLSPVAGHNSAGVPRTYGQQWSEIRKVLGDSRRPRSPSEFLGGSRKRSLLGGFQRPSETLESPACRPVVFVSFSEFIEGVSPKPAKE